MRKNKVILEEAARSVRRTFIGSVAGSVCMLGVIGAAGAYGMPEKLTAHALAAAMTTLNVSLSPMVGRAKVLAESSTSLTPVAQTASISALIPPRENPVVRSLPEIPAGVAIGEPTQLAAPQAPVAAAPRAVALAEAEPLVAEPLQEVAVEMKPVPQPEPAPVVAMAKPAPTPAPAPITTPAPVRAMPMVESVRAMPAVEAVVAGDSLALAVESPAVPVTVEPAAASAMAAAQPADVPLPEAKSVLMASLTPPAAPVVTAEQAIVSAALIFETPKLEKIPALTEMPKTAPVAAIPAESVAADQVAAIALPKPGDFLQNVWAHLLQSKPPLSPAQRLSLQGKEYDKAEHCLAQAVYFEARNEPTRGQEAVAQVVLNRVFSPYYPKDVCSVVYQNAHRYLSCQFTFACDGKPESITEQGAWARANRVAKAALDAKVWLPDVDKATHYHAAYVRPNWIRDMRVMVRYGLHTFYRPRNWGDGSDEPHWGNGSNSPKKGRV
jgi:hypothetical protein